MVLTENQKGCCGHGHGKRHPAEQQQSKAGQHGQTGGDGAERSHPHLRSDTVQPAERNCRDKDIPSDTYTCLFDIFLNTSRYLKQDRIEIEMARKYVTEKRGITESELVSNSFCLDIDVK